MDVATLMHHPNVEARMSDVLKMSQKERMQLIIDSYNSTVGNLNEKDGFNCTACKNKGEIAVLFEYPEGIWRDKYQACKCATARSCIRKMKESGLGNVIRDKTFDAYEATEPWQKAIKTAAMQYAKNASGWFFLGGQPGSGKSHLGAAICREFLLAGKSVAYMVWPDDSAAIKGAATDYEQREKLLGRFKRANVLYIDDLFKPSRSEEHGKQRPTGPDVRLAFEILNFRYNDPSLLTIISSEFSTDELLAIDEAFGSRIIEKSVALNIAEDISRNYRLRGAMSV